MFPHTLTLRETLTEVDITVYGRLLVCSVLSWRQGQVTTTKLVQSHFVQCAMLSDVENDHKQPAAFLHCQFKSRTM